MKNSKLAAELIKKINSAANIIAQKQRSGPGNYIITNSEVANKLNEVYEIEEMKKKQELRLKKLKRLLEDDED